jgi:hypothetical protein
VWDCSPALACGASVVGENALLAMTMFFYYNLN